MKSIITLLFLSLLSLSISAHRYNEKVSAYLATIDSLILRFDETKQARQIEIDLIAAVPMESTLQERYEYHKRLFEEYLRFDTDSALVHANQCFYLANQIGSLPMVHYSHIQKSFLNAITGQLHESVAELQQIETATLSPKVRVEYFGQLALLYSRFAEYTDEGRGDRRDYYYQREMDYIDSTLVVLPFNDPYRIIYRALRNLKFGDYAQSIAELSGYISASPQVNLINSQMLDLLASLYRDNGQEEQQIECLCEMAIIDLKLCNYDNSSLRNLAVLLNRLGNNDRAYCYMSKCIEMATLLNNRVRMISCLKDFGEIQRTHLQIKERDNRHLTLLLVITFCSLLMTIGAFMYIYRILRHRTKQRVQLGILNKQLTESNQELANTNFLLEKKLEEITFLHQHISDVNQQLDQLNAQLRDTNAQLERHNEVKEEQIGFAFTLCSDYISKIDQYRKNVNRLVRTNQHKELIRATDTPLLVESELKAFYQVFDTVFLHVYPHFVQDFNALLQPDQRITPKGEGRLNTDLRIFALMRLGISDSSKIADFLHSSVQTVYNSRQRTRQKAIDREAFNEQVLKLGK